MSFDWNGWNREVMAEFRANEGKVGDQFEGATMIIVTTTGAKTGEKRENPLVRLDEGGRTYIIASKGGAPHHPDWYHNLVANPEVKVELGTDTYQARAEVVEDDAERDRLYAEQVKRIPSFAEYEQKTTRRIPVIALERID